MKEKEKIEYRCHSKYYSRWGKSVLLGSDNGGSSWNNDSVVGPGYKKPTLKNIAGSEAADVYSLR